MYRVGIQKEFQARHFLVGDFAEETIPHSHRYIVDLAITTGRLDEHGFSVDIALLEEVTDVVLSELDDVLLNELPFFENRQASVENCAHFIHDVIFARLVERDFNAATITRSEVKIWESETAWASYVDRNKG